MKQIIVNLYSINELEPKAKERALNDLRQNESYFTCERVSEAFEERLNDLGLNLKAFWSLSYSQGDGVAFSGNLTRECILKNIPEITAQELDLIDLDSVDVSIYGNYTHKNSMSLEVLHYNKESSAEIVHKIEKACLKYLQSLSVEFERMGYAEIEHLESEKNLIELSEANEWTYEVNGEMRNE